MNVVLSGSQIIQVARSQEIAENPYAALLFYWANLNHQVRVEGTVEKFSEEESDAYFHSRPRGSQIGAIGTMIPGRDVLYEEYEELEAKFADGSIVPKPKHWFRLKPRTIEFWQGQQSCLHDRILYILTEWKASVENCAPGSMTSATSLCFIVSCNLSFYLFLILFAFP